MKKQIRFTKCNLYSFVFIISLITAPSFNHKRIITQNGEWLITGSMNNYRFGHTETLLPNGKVLVAGGCGDISCSSYTATAELYDPATGVWTDTGSLHAARVVHSAVLLPNGKVLVAGGHVGNTILNSAELYDPAIGTWTIINPMIDARYSFGFALLPSGEVLVAGGVGEGFLYISNSELFDPTSGNWETTGSLNIERAQSPIISLENGKVLIAGGFNGVSLTSAELYDTETGTWTYTGSMHENHNTHTLIQLDNGKVLFAGANSNGSCELYDPGTGTWAYTGSMNEVLLGAAVVRLPNGKVLAASGISTSAEIYDPTTGLWTSISPMNVAKPGEAIGVLLPNGDVLVAGGTSAELYYENYSPTADAGPDQSVNTISPVTLDGSGSSDPNEDPITYLWLQTGGTPVTLSDPNSINPTFTTPNDPDILTFELVVTDTFGLSSEPDTVLITVNNQAPVADAGPDQSMDTLSLVTLDGSGSSDPDGDLPLSFLWTQTGGTTVELNDPTDVTPSFIAPNDPDILTFELIVTDTLGLPSEMDDVSITINNQAPIADAGSDQTVKTMTFVTLDGSGSSDLDGDLPLSYLWIQTSGITVELDAPTSVNPSFTAPNSSGALTFSLIVTDSLGLSSEASEVVINVEKYNIFVPLIIR